MTGERRTPAARTLASGSRVALLHLLQEGGRHTIAELAEAAGLHENTTREHLQRLVRDGFAVREPEHRTVRGRPRMLYRATSADDARADPLAIGRLEEAIAHVALTKVLLGGYGRDVGDTPEAARQAGRALAQPGGPLELPPDERGGEHGDEHGDERGDEPDSRAETRQLHALEGHLDRLGFDPEFEAEPMRFHLWRCPFLSLALDRPDVVCNVHLGLANGVLETAGGPVVTRRLRPFVGREHCILELQRTPT